MVILGEFNAHSQNMNVYWEEGRDAAELEQLVDTYNLIVNNELEKATRPTRSKITSIINLRYTTPDIGILDI